MDQDKIERFKELLNARVSISAISKELSVSRQTLYNIIYSENLNYSKTTDITDVELKTIIQQIKLQHPTSGEVMVTGHLRSQNIHVQRHRIRNIIHEIDPEGVKNRQSSAIKRRSYSAPCPHYVWHIDGNHKLILWKFVIHGAIDGYTRLITFLKVSNNNDANTVYSQFDMAVSEFQRPLRVRTDHGGENQKVWENMIATRGVHSVMVGSSVHNERIERLWRDVTEKVSSKYINLFRQMEDDYLLNRDNMVDILSLHFVFMRLIQRDLSDFGLAHNYHGISTEGSLSPLQLYALKRQLTDLHEEDYIPEDGANITDITGPLPHVQCTTGCFSTELSHELKRLQKAKTMKEGEQLYCKVVDIVGKYIERTGHL